MKLTVITFLLSLSFAALAFEPANVKCMKDAKKRGMKMEDVYQICSVKK